MQVLKCQSNAQGNAPAYLSNGLVGLRIGAVPLPAGTALVSGYCDISRELSSEQYAEAPYPVGADICLEGIWMSERPDFAVFRSQEYDLSCGELISRFDFAAKGHTAHVEVVTFCSRTHPTLTLQEVTLTIDLPCQLVMQAHIDPRGIDGRLRSRWMPERGCDGIIEWESRGGLCTLGAAYRSEMLGEDLLERRRNNYSGEQDLALTRYVIKAKPGKRYVLRQISSLVPGNLHDEPHWQASRMSEVGMWCGFDEIREDNRDAWEDIWKGRPVILGADGVWQEATDAAYFYLHSSVSQATPCSVAPFGLSRRSEYHGHVFWDTDTFMFPPVLLTAPKAARAMLDYRSRLLQSARNNASLSGYRGIQFPWQSGLTGSECTPAWCGANGAREHHINTDVAFAFAQYAHASGDDIFTREQAWPVLQGVADWITSRVKKTDRGYEIRHVTGIDEFLENVNNNSYTNMGAIVVLREATDLARRLGFNPPSSWLEVAEGMYLPIDPETNVIRKNDSFEYTGGMLIPEAMFGYYPFTYSHSPEVDKATYSYYLDHAHTYLGMPMGSALCGVWAARMGDRARSREFFSKGFINFLVEPYHQFNESVVGTYGNPAHTVFLTNASGFLMSLMMGLPGLQFDEGAPEDWAKFPVVMPDGWDGIDIERIWVRGRQARLSARHGDAHASIEPID